MFRYPKTVFSQNLNTVNTTFTARFYTHTLGKKEYELTNHASAPLSASLGNVLATVLDRKTGVKGSPTATTYAWFKADVTTAQDYYPFGSLMPGRTYVAPTGAGYRFGFNGMQRDDEIKGPGNSLDFGARMYDSRLGRWMSVDPLESKYPEWSPFNYALNNPIIFIDPDGRDVDVSTLSDKNHQEALRNLVSTEVGYQFIAQFARAGDVIGGVKFSTTGSRANDLLVFNSASNNMSGRKGLTRTFFRTETGDYGKRLRFVEAKDVGPRNFVFLVDLKVGLSEDESTNTMAHESLVHVNSGLNEIKKIEKRGREGSYKDLYEVAADLRAVDQSADADHSLIANGKALDYKKFAEQLDKKNGSDVQKKLYKADVSHMKRITGGK